MAWLSEKDQLLKSLFTVLSYVISPDSISVLVSTNDIATKHVRKMIYAIPKGSPFPLEKGSFSYASQPKVDTYHQSNI
jgi:hypothetical protein